MYKRGNGTNAFKEEKEWGKVKERKRNVGSGQKQKGRGDRWNAFAILGEACKPFWYAKSPEHTALHRVASKEESIWCGDRPLYFIHISFHPVVTNFGGIFLHSTVTIISRNCFLDLS